MQIGVYRCGLAPAREFFSSVFLVVTCLRLFRVAPEFCNSFEGPLWGFKSTGAQRAACLRAMGKAIGNDTDVRENKADCRTQTRTGTQKGPIENCFSHRDRLVHALCPLALMRASLRVCACVRACLCVRREGSECAQPNSRNIPSFFQELFPFSSSCFLRFSFSVAGLCQAGVGGQREAHPGVRRGHRHGGRRIQVRADTKNGRTDRTKSREIRWGVSQ